MNDKKSIYQPDIAQIVNIKKLTENEKLFEMSFINGRKRLGHLPGQFVELSVFGVGEAPISVSSSPTRGDNFELAIRKVGNVTGALHRMEVGDKVGIRGPFGTHFPTEESEGKDLLFVAGGIGLIPLRSFIYYVLDNRDKYKRIIIFFGCKTVEERLFTDELREWEKREDVELVQTIDKPSPAWKGNVGVITTCFPKIEIDAKKTVCSIVGPPVMYKFCLKEAKSRGIPDDNIIFSLERRMKCGVGKCGHCQINGVYVCQDGPVFRYSQIKDLKEAI
ncbi:MAG: FAD/NAD(P)-binding protein [Candidatus Aerophobetes bacterium]|nr:FAD/NAD(P)-binding protein [Candidatus Aerophobetes bacterium]